RPTRSDGRRGAAGTPVEPASAAASSPVVLATPRPLPSPLGAWWCVAEPPPFGRRIVRTTDWPRERGSVACRVRTTNAPCPVSDQGKPAARRGRKARDLQPTRTETARLPDPQGSVKH